MPAPLLAFAPSLPTAISSRVAPRAVAHVSPSLYALPLTRRRPRPHTRHPLQPRPRISLPTPRRRSARACPPWTSSSVSTSDGPHYHAEDSYLQCPQCFAMYHVEADELEGPPRIVACSACLHEWYASGETLIWGDDTALDAIHAADAATSDTDRSDEKAMAAVRGVQSVRRSPNPNISDKQSDSVATSGTKTDKNFESGKGAAMGTSFPDAGKVVNQRAGPPLEVDDDTDEFDYDDDGDGDHNMDDGVDDAVHDRVNDGVDDGVDEAGSDQSESPGLDDAVSSQFFIPTQQNDVSSTTRSELDTEKTTRRKGKDSNNLQTFKDPNRVQQDDSPLSVFVGNLSFRATEEDLYRAFSGYGAVLSCQVPSDPSSGASKGYGFVEMQNRSSALRAIESLQGASILGRDVSLNVARPRTRSSTGRGVRSGGGSGSGGERKGGKYESLSRNTFETENGDSSFVGSRDGRRRRRFHSGEGGQRSSRAREGGPRSFRSSEGGQRSSRSGEGTRKSSRTGEGTQRSSSTGENWSRRESFEDRQKK